MKNLLETEPARLMSLVHALLTLAATTGVLIAEDPRVQFAIGAAAILGDWLAGQAVRDRVSPAYSDGHPITNTPPDGITQP